MYFLNKKLHLYLNNRRIKFNIQNLNDTAYKIYKLNAKDSTSEYTGIKISLDDVVEMEVGDDLGMVAHLLPHTYLRSNPFNLETSDKNIVDVDGMVLTAKEVGTATITTRTLDGQYSDSITVNVVKPSDFTTSINETYTLDPSLFNLIEYDNSKDLSVLDEEAWSNSNAIQFIFLYMNRNGYKKVVFPKNKTYLFHPVNHIYCKNNILVDLNGSTLQTVPHAVASAVGMYMFDTKNKINICPRGWVGLERKTMFKINQTEFADYAYPLPTTGSADSYYVDGEIRVLDSDDASTEYKDFVVKGKTYNGSFQFAKYMVNSIDKTQYTSNTIKLIAECYKGDTLVKEIGLFSHTWNTQNFYGIRDFSLNVNGDINTIKFKAVGLGETQGTEIVSALGNLKIYALDENIQEMTENIIFENGSILGDRMLKNGIGEEIKSNLFNEAFGFDWRNIYATESTQNIAMVKGKNIGCRNMTIGNSVGFNITIDGAKRISCHYPDAKLMTIGGLGENGEEVDKTDYARFKEFVEVDISKSNKIRITDPTFSTNYYYKYQSRIIDVYCYDSSKNFIKSLKGKLRHGILKLPVNTKYIKIAVPLLVNQGETLITTGNSDFNNCIFAIEVVEPLEKSFLKNCIIENNYSTGIAHSGNGFLIEGCTFNNNTGRMPWCDIDSEDGWVKMQNNVFRNNTFNSYWGTIMCAGTNYVFKNNIYNGSFTLYGQCQYFKIIGNVFNCPTNPSFDTQADEYLIKNIFSNVKQINVGCEQSSAEYKCYYGDNVFDTIRLNENRNSLYDIGGNSYNKLEISGDGNATEDVICNSIPSNGCKGEIIITCATNMSNISIPNIIKANKQKITFNNCEIFNNAEVGGSYSVIYNNCTLYNRNLLSESGSTYNDCTFIDGVNRITMINGIVEDGLILNKNNVTSFASQKMQELKIEPNKFASFSVSAMVNCYNNFFFNPIVGCAITQFGSSPIATNAEFGGVKLELASGKFETKKYTTNIGDTKYYVATMTYDSNAGKFKYYINETLAAEVTLSADATFKDHSNYSGDNALIRTTGQSKVNNYYLYNRVLSEDEILQNISVLSQLMPPATIYGDIVVDTSIEVPEDGEKLLGIKLNKMPTQEQNVKIDITQNNLQLTKLKLSFTPENYNDEQYITVKGYKDTVGCSDKTDTIKISTLTGYTLKQDLFVNNIIGGNTVSVSVKVANTISNPRFEDRDALVDKVKSLYPQCLNFRGSFDWPSFTTALLSSSTAGDFWINDKTSIQKLSHSRIFSPNDIVYYDGEYINPLYIPRVTSTVQEKYDICIIGGGAGGVACAYALKDKGLKVCLIERLDLLGGTHLNSVNTLISNPIVPFKDNWLRKILEPLYDLGKLEICKYGETTGIGEGTEFDRLWRNSHITYSNRRGVQFVLSPSYMSNKYYTDLQDTIDIKLNTVFVSSNFTDKKVTSIMVKNLDEDNIYEIKADYFVDCSGDGVLCRYGKTLDEDFYIGEDPRDRFDEPTYKKGYAGDHYAINTVEGSFIMGPSGIVGNGDKLRKPDFSNVEVFDDVIKKGNSAGVDAFCGYVVVSTSNGCPIPSNVFIDEGYDAAFELAKRKSLYYAYIMNQNYMCNKMLGIRESYRIKCEYMITQHDMEIRPTTQSIKEKNIIALSTWWVDIHNGTASVKNSGMNEIPYNSLVPCAFSNVLIGSRCMGASHIAQSSCRLTRCMMSIGYVCGLALDQCVKNDIEDVRGVNVENIQQEIGIYELFNEVDSWQLSNN